MNIKCEKDLVHLYMMNIYPGKEYILSSTFNETGLDLMKRASFKSNNTINVELSVNYRVILFE